MSPMLGREPVVSSVAAKCVSHSATVNRRLSSYTLLLDCDCQSVLFVLLNILRIELLNDTCICKKRICVHLDLET